ncbi:glycoside hydrolase domain-containing protein [Nocardioides marmotae]|uniref:glycoside hydrolase domain-containing protein n=1 Tax=Nocardioides marmotae TaxID=2663857 RepID=UPI0012B65050|nr:glycoside hydrolase domain-containing protein [Nocardioides marmotae]MBC9732747.1 DUF1906 domain-containing protein [Nocardioides marmotae]MTB83862.1 DUF1906 domain-containing protein [Nocardioides marmotae]
MRRRTTAVLSALLGGALLLGPQAAGAEGPAAAPAGATGADAPASTASAPVVKKSTNPVTPGDFTGHGFDQCLAPEQWKMNRWLKHSPFLAVGIYISGDSRACRSQPNLTPAWVTKQLKKGWRLLPITLGPQASCHPRFPRYADDVKINPKPGNNGRYFQARQQGFAEAEKAVAAATALGLARGSTLFYDLEGYDSSNTHCRESALAFVGAWTEKLHALGWVSGVYSSAGSGIKDLDDARVNRPGTYTLPDTIWIARWDGVANTSTSYIREDGWRPGGRVKQYRGDHVENWGGVKINIDSNFLDVGRGSVAAPESRCGGVRVSYPVYAALRPATGNQKPSDARQVKALQCLLKEQGRYAGALTGTLNARTLDSIRAFQAARGFPVRDRFTKANWMSLHAVGSSPVLKRGSAGSEVRRVQRAINAADPKAKVVVTGVFDARTDTAVRAWQKKIGLPVSGVVNPESWAALRSGVR